MYPESGPKKPVRERDTRRTGDISDAAPIAVLEPVLKTVAR